MSARTRTYVTLFFSLSLILSSSWSGAVSPVRQDLKLKTVVLDAGHGGHDPGAVSKDGKTREKDLTLKISKLVGAKILRAYPDIKVVYTRPDDKFVTLGDRADIANKSQANLFISIHINANESTQPDGFSTHILGESSKKNTDLWAYNMNVCKRENSVILLEDDYSTKYQGFDPSNPESFIFFHLMQNAFYEQSLLFAADVQDEIGKSTSFQHNRGIHQDPFFVLWKTTMPSVLIENGFISNQKDLALLRTDEGLESIADGIFNAFVKFKARYDGSTAVSKPEPGAASSQTRNTQPEAGAAWDVDGRAAAIEEPKAGEKAAERPVEAKADAQQATRYGVQVVVSSRIMESGDPFFRGYPVTRYRAGNAYKYIVCEQTDEESLRKKYQEVKKKFPDSFMVKIDGESIIFWGRR